MDVSLVEFQMTTLTIVLFLLSWYTQEVAYALVWYFLKLLEFFIIVTQWFIITPYPNGHVDSWGSPFAAPSFFLTQLTVLLVYIFVFHLWWHRPTWKPSYNTILYTLLLVGLGAYWLLLIPFYWGHVLFSILFGIAYGLLSALFVRFVFIPLWLETILDRFQNTTWSILVGNKNTLMMDRNLKSSGKSI